MGRQSNVMRFKTSRLSPRVGTNMVKDIRLEINFNNLYSVYYSGNSVRGDVILDIHQSFKLKGEFMDPFLHVT